MASFSIILRLYDKSFNRYEVKTSLILLLLFFSLSLSYIVNENYMRLFGELNTFILYFYIFMVMQRYVLVKYFMHIIMAFIIIFSIIPILLLFIGYLDYDIMDGFGGFASHRNHYAIMLGFSFLIVLFFWQGKSKYIVLSLMVIGLWLSGSRGSWIGLISAILVYINLNNEFTVKNMVKNISIIFVIYIVYEMYMMYKYGFQPHGDSNRILIIQLFFESIKDNFFFGVGRNLFFEMEIFESNVYAHNFIIQIFANYGFFTLIIFIGFIMLQIKNLSNKSKVLLIYVLIVGLFQPLFDVRFTPFYLLALLILLYFENYNKEKDKIYA